MSSPEPRCAIFWDYENCSPPANVPGYIVAEQIRSAALKFGPVTVFKAYLELSTVNITPKIINLRSELQSSGVSLTDCPRMTARKDVVDKMLLVDMLAFALDNPAPAVIMLISGDRDFVYAVSVLRHRRYTVVVVIPPHGAHITLKSQANVVLDWKYDIFADSLETRPEMLLEAKRRQSFGAGGEELCGRASLKEAPPLPTSPPLPTLPLLPDLFKPEPTTKAESSSSSGSTSSTDGAALLRSPRTPAAQLTDLPPIPGDILSSYSSVVASTTPQPSPKKQRPLAGAGASAASYSDPIERVTSPPSSGPRSFNNLIEILEQWRLMGNHKPLRSQIGVELKKKNPLLYERSGVSGFSEYVALAEKANVVQVGSGNIPGKEWIALSEKFRGKVFPVYTGP